MEVATIDLEHERRLTEVESRSKSNTKRIDDLEKNSEALNSLATSVAVMAEKQNGMAEKQDTMVDAVDSIAQKVSNIEQKPVKRWEAVAGQIISLVVAAVVGYALSRLGF